MACRTSCVCGRVVGKAKSLGCYSCGTFFHVSCIDVDDEDLRVLSKKKPGFKWHCTVCDTSPLAAKDATISQQTLDDLKTALIGEVSGTLAAVADNISKINDRLNILETPAATPDIPSFANIVKQSVAEATRELTNTSTKKVVEVMDNGKLKKVHNQQVLIVKTKPDAQPGTVPPNPDLINKALASIPVDSCATRDSGTLVVKLPSEEAKAQASNALNSRLGTDSNYCVTEPKKMLPKITLTGIPDTLGDEDIIPSILSKNPQIRHLSDKNHTLQLIFTRNKGNNKMAILKISPEIRSAIVHEHNRVYVGLTRCRAYDRFWVTQCYHCQGFGHNKDSCNKKLAEPKCVFCAGGHNSKDCTNKHSPKCVNCSSLKPGEADSGPPLLPESLAHFASSRHCPIMISQRKRLIENTNFTDSKNF